MEKKIQEIYSENDIDQEKLNQIQKELHNKGVTPQNVYLFIDAHTLSDSVVKPLLNRITIKLAGGHHKKMTSKN